ncbi:MAG: SufE family protein, partial [Rhodobacteraceae bacterium]|nr:SufE family protein [Paracoccaceae bacterium]
MASAAFEEIVEDFEFLDEWEDRYRYVIDRGRAMAPLDEAL